MAVRGTEDVDTNRPATAAPGVDPAAQAPRAPGYSTDTGGNRLFSMLNQLGSGHALGPDAEKYIEGVKSYFSKDLAPPVLVRRLSEPNGAHVFSIGENAIVLLFEASLMRDTQKFLPTSDYGEIVDKAFRREISNNKYGPLNFIIVQTEDYTRPQQMATHIQVLLTIASNPQYSQSTVADLANTEFVVDTNVETARAYIEQRNPHTTQPRIDIGFTIYAKNPRRAGTSLIGMEESRPIAAVGAYTEIWRQGDDTRSFMPTPQTYNTTVHITNITSDIPIAGIIPLCLATAADHFISQRRWLQPYMTFQKGKPNIGNLATDPNDPKKLWFANTKEELFKWMSIAMSPGTLLSLDVVEGQARIPAVALYGHDAYSNRVFEQMTSFFGNVSLDTSKRPFRLYDQEFIGLYGDSRSKLIDSREIDYLNLLAHGGAQDSSANYLLQNFLDPSVRARVVFEKSGNTFRSMWRTQTSVIGPELLMSIAREITQRVNVTGPMRQDVTLQSPWVDDIAKRYAESSFATSAGYKHTIGYNGGFYNV